MGVELSTMLTPRERFERACHELGWGDARQGLWFVGLEESTEWEAKDVEYIDKFYGHREFFRTPAVELAVGLSDIAPPTTRSNIAIVQALIATPLSRSYDNPRAFSKKIWEQGTRVAHANVFPLGKPRTNGALPAQYAALFGFGPNDQARYVEEVRKLRFRAFAEARRELGPQAIVCMGKSGWDEFRAAFGLVSVQPEVHVPKLEIYPADRVILTPHWSRNLVPPSLAEQISSVLKNWGVTLP
jgi:hypothetical protein